VCVCVCLREGGRLFLARAAGAVSNFGDWCEREVPRDASLEGVRTLRSWTGTEKTSWKDSGVQSPSYS
jgi:hypothetical protein